MGAVEYLSQPPVFVTIAALVGLAVGSFLNVVIHRLPKMMEREWQAECAAARGEALPAGPRYDLVTPRSSCPACGHRITALVLARTCQYALRAIAAPGLVVTIPVKRTGHRPNISPC